MDGIERKFEVIQGGRKRKNPDRFTATDWVKARSKALELIAKGNEALERRSVVAYLCFEYAGDIYSKFGSEEELNRAREGYRRAIELLPEGLRSKETPIWYSK